MAEVARLSVKVDPAKNVFFDSPAILRRASAARKRNLSRLGAFVRTRAITLLLRHFVGKGFGAQSRVRDRHKGEVAPPGQPPYAHTGELARFLFFGWDAPNQCVVVGPALLNKASSALRQLEEGGAATLTRVIRARRDRPRMVFKRRAFFRPHPFMRPALEQTKEQAPKVWENTIR